jgi:hypothetical protein
LPGIRNYLTANLDKKIMFKNHMKMMRGSQDVSAAIPPFQSKRLSANANFLSARFLSGESHDLGFSDMDVSGPQLSPEVSDITAQTATNVRKRPEGD